MSRKLATRLVLLLALPACGGPPGTGGPGLATSTLPDYSPFDRRFTQDVTPVLEKYCFSCHGGAQPASMLDLTAFDDAGEIVAGYGVWEHVAQRLEAGEMPP